MFPFETKRKSEMRVQLRCMQTQLLYIIHEQFPVPEQNASNRGAKTSIFWARVNSARNKRAEKDRRRVPPGKKDRSIWVYE